MELLAIEKDGKFVFSSHKHSREEIVKEKAKYYWELIRGGHKQKFKIGDRVILDQYPCIVNKVEWRGDSKYVGYVYTVIGTDFGRKVKEEDLVLDLSKEETKSHNNMCKQLINEMNPNVEVETETHRGYYTTEGEDTNESKKVAWFTFWDNDFADKVELDLSDRELIQEDGKWFVVKKKPKYPQTYEECCRVVNANSCIRLVYNLSDGQKYYHDEDNLCLYENFRRLKICRDAYWKLYGEEMGLGKPWEPTMETVYCISRNNNVMKCSYRGGKSNILEFPTEEMRDAFYENFKKEIEECKEFL